MILKGKQVVLRPIEFEDLEFIRSMINNPVIEKSIVGWTVPLSRKDEEVWYSSYKNTTNEIRYIIELNGKAVGLTGIASIDWKNGCVTTSGIRIGSDSQGKGIATDAYMTMLKYIFLELRMNRANASALEFNSGSLRFMEKCGYEREGIQRNAVYKNGTFHNLVILGLLKDDYIKVAREKGYL